MDHFAHHSQVAFPEAHLVAPLVIWAVDGAGTFILSEGAGLQSLGLRPGEAVGQSIWEMFRDHPDALSLVRAGLRGERFSGLIQVGEIHFETRCAPLRDEFQQVIGVVGVSIEIARTSSPAPPYPRSSDLYRQLALQLPVVTFIAEPEAPYRRLYVSSQSAAETGLPTQSWADAGGEWLERVHVDDRAAALRHLQQAVDEMQIVTGELRLVSNTGRVVFVEEHLVAVRDASLRPVCLQGILLDITARKVAESQSEASSAYLRLLVEAANDGIFTVGRDGCFDYANPRIAEMLEIDSSQILSRHFTDFLLPDDREAIVGRFERRMEGHAEPRNYEVRIQTAKGNTFWSEINLTPLKVAEQFMGSLVVLRDITRRKATENELAEIRAKLETRVFERTRDVLLANQVLEEQIQRAREVTDQLQESEDKWRSLVENAPQFVILLDREGRYRFINRVVAGFDIKKVIGACILDMIPPQHIPLVRTVLKRVFEQGQPQTYEIDSYGAHGQVAWYSVSVGPIFSKSEGRVTTAVMIAEDITTRKVAEAALQKRQLELEHISRLNVMGALTAELAHELNQPLEAISAYATACLRSLGAENIQSPRVDDALQKISQQSSRAGQIIQKILDFVHKRDNPRQFTDINRLIREVVSFAELEARRHQISIEFDLDPDLPEVPVKQVQIEQVLMNLLLNAMDAIRAANAESPLIRVRTRSVDGEDVQVSVSDNGCGFDKLIADNMFQPFYSTKGQGLGMGLSISRTIVDEHGGRIWATSEPGKGAVFTFLLPGGSQRIALVRNRGL